MVINKINKTFDLKGSSYWNSWHTIYIKTGRNVSNYVTKGRRDASFRLVLSY